MRNHKYSGLDIIKDCNQLNKKIDFIKDLKQVIKRYNEICQ